MHDHADRQAILEEVHARPVVVVPKQCRLWRIAFLPDTANASIAPVLARLQAWCANHGHPVPPDHTRQHTFAPTGAGGGHLVTWEFHNEFVTVTWSADRGNTDPHPGNIGLELVDDIARVAAARIDITTDLALPERMTSTFNPSSLCHVTVEGGAAAIATDFIDDSDSYVRFEFAAGNLTELRRSILARRLLEIECYSKLALLGLPPVRAAAPELGDLEAAISDCIRQLPEISGLAPARAAIDRLNQLSLRTAALADRLSYRIAASRAYGQIVTDRLRALDDRSTGVGSNISVYLENRIVPAVRTLVAFDKRLTAAAERIERTAMMLNARNGLELEMQNGEILSTILKTARSQFRLQQTVEGLSVIAITYYLIGILGYALAAPLHALEWNKDWMMSALTPIALILVWWGSRRLWGRSRN